MVAIATLIRISRAGRSRRVVRSVRGDDGWTLMKDVYRVLTNMSPEEAENIMVYPGVGTAEEHIDNRAVGSIKRKDLMNRDRASRYLSDIAHELDGILARINDPATHHTETGLDVQVYRTRGYKWRVSLEWPLSVVFSISAYPERIIDIVEGRFAGLPGEACWTRLADGTVVTAEFIEKDDLGYNHFALRLPSGDSRLYSSEYPHGQHSA